MEINLGKRISSGIGWNFVNQILTQTLQIGIMVILARLLTPRDYGMVGLVSTFLGFAAIFVDFGLSQAVIRKQDSTETDFSTVFWSNLALGSSMFLVLWLLAGPIAAFYKEPGLIAVIRVSAALFILSPLGSLHRSLLVKQLRFRALSLTNTSALMMASCVAVTMAANGFGYWSLVAHNVATQLFTTLALWRVVAWRPKLVFQRQAILGMLGFSGFFSATLIVGYWSRSLDKILLGRMSGASELGLYSRAYMLMLLPLQQVSQVVDTVLFPAFSTIGNDKEKIALIYLKITRLVALITFPLSFGLWILAEPIVIGLYGERWHAVVPILQILCPLGAIQSILYLGSSLYLSQGRTRRAFIFTCINTPILGAAFYYGLRANGLLGMLWAYFAVVIATAPFSYLAAASLVGLRILDMSRNLAGVTGAVLVMVLILMFVKPYSSALSAWSQIGILVPLGAAIYVGTLHLLQVPAFKEALTLIRTKLRPTREASSLTQPQEVV